MHSTRVQETRGGSSFCRPKWPDARPLTGELTCERCGLGTDNGWHDGQTIDIQVTCPRCGREIAVLSGDAHLEGFEYREVGHPPEWIDGYVSDLVLGHDWDKKAKGARHSAQTPDLMTLHSAEQRLDEGTTTKFVLVCPDERRCRYRRVVSYPRASRAMISAWRRGSHKIVAGLDL
jgi:hypothetical protein